MHRNQAAEIIKALGELAECINQLDGGIDAVVDVEEQKTLRRYVGSILAAHYDLVEFVVEQYPDLRPDYHDDDS